MDIMEETLRNNNNDYKNIGDLRRQVLSSFVEKTSQLKVFLFSVDMMHQWLVSYSNCGEQSETRYLWLDSNIQTTLIPYAKKLIELLYQHGFILGIITNGTADLSEHSDVNPLFTAFVNSDVCGDRKPTRIPFDKVTTLHRVNPQMKEILGIYDSSMYLHVGDDYSSDVEGAHNAGWKSVLISSNFSLPPKGKKAPDICVSSMKELYLLFKSVLDTFVVC